MCNNRTQIIIICADISPKKGSEAGKAFLWLNILAEKYVVHVIAFDEDIEDIKNLGLNSKVLLHSAGQRRSSTNRLLRPLLLSRFFHVAGNLAKNIAKQYKISLVHFLTPSGAHTISSIPSFKEITVRGPLGGGLPYPKGFNLPLMERAFYRIRRCYYSALKHSTLSKNFYNKINHILIGTQYLYDVLPSAVHKNCTIMFDTFIDSNLFKPASMTLDNVNFRFLFATATITPRKGLDAVISAFTQISSKHPNAVLHIYGNGAVRTAAEKKVQTSALKEKIIFFDAVSRLQLAELLPTYDVFCLPCFCEPGGAAILEAMSCGVPVITSDYGGPAYSIADGCGIKIPLHNYEDFITQCAHWMDQLASNPEMRRNISKNARAHIQDNFSMEAYRAKIITFYSRILKSD